MTTYASYPPHPLLQEPVLYVLEVPNRIKWQHLQQVFSPCDKTVTTKGRSIVPDTKLKKWTVQFSDLLSADMALTTLQGAPIPGLVPPLFLSLSHSPFLKAPTPKKSLLPRYIKTTIANHPVLSASAQIIFNSFRRAGPLVNVRVKVEVGYSHPTCVLEYWEQKHADIAAQIVEDYSKTIPSAASFVLQTFDPFALHCTDLGSSFQHTDLQQIFGKFGKAKEVRIEKPSTSEASGFISFHRRDEAAHALKEMNGTLPRGRRIVVRYHEPPEQPRRHTNVPGDDGHTSWFQFAESAKSSDAAAGKTTEAHADENAQKAARDEEARQREARLKAARMKREVLEALERMAREARESAEKTETKLKSQLSQALEVMRDAQQRSEDAKRQLEEAEVTFEEHKRLLEKSTHILIEARSELTRAQQDADEASTAGEKLLEQQQEALQQKEEAEREEKRVAADRERAELEERQARASCQHESEEDQRKKELAESIRKLQELRKQEEEDRARMQREAELAESRRKMAEFEAEEKRKRAQELAEKAAKRRAKEEREKQLREEQERKAREEREREEAARRAELERRAAHERATAAEIERCQLRDQTLRPRHIPWNSHASLARFKLVSAEFDVIKYSELQPLTFEGVPWPVLHWPRKMFFEGIDWQAVEAFFEELESMLPGREYKILVEKTHRRFHPDKWRARGLLNTVLDDTSRVQLESTGNIVAQAMTPIWTKSRSIS